MIVTGTPAKQPNGLPDHSEEWISPELLIRRLVYANLSHSFSKMENNNNEYYENIVQKNFDNPGKIMRYLDKKIELSKNKLYYLIIRSS